jgi:hypothetical protein
MPEMTNKGTWVTEKRKCAWDTERARALKGPDAPCGFVGSYGRYGDRVSPQVHRCNRWDCKKGCGMTKKIKYVEHFCKLLEGKSVYVREFSTEYWDALRVQLGRAHQNYIAIKTVDIDEGEPWWSDKMVIVTDKYFKGCHTPAHGLRDFLEKCIPDRIPYDEKQVRVVTHSKEWALPKEDEEKSDDYFRARLPSFFAKWVAVTQGLIMRNEQIKDIRVDDEKWKNYDAKMVEYDTKIKNNIYKAGREYNDREIKRECFEVRKAGGGYDTSKDTKIEISPYAQKIIDGLRAKLKEENK